MEKHKICNMYTRSHVSTKMKKGIGKILNEIHFSSLFEKKRSHINIFQKKKKKN